MVIIYGAQKRVTRGGVAFIIECVNPSDLTAGQFYILSPTALNWFKHLETIEMHYKAQKQDGYIYLFKKSELREVWLIKGKASEISTKEYLEAQKKHAKKLSGQEPQLKLGE